MWGSRRGGGGFLLEISSGDGTRRIAVGSNDGVVPSIFAPGLGGILFLAVPRYRASPATCIRRGGASLSIKGSVSFAFNAALAAEFITYLLPRPGGCD